MAKKDGFHDRLQRFISYLGLKPTSFEAAVGFSNGSIGKALSEKRAIGSDRLETIVSKYPELNLSWLLTGVGEMLTKPAKNFPGIAESFPVVQENLPKYGAIDNHIRVPLVDISVAAGSGYQNPEFFEPEGFIDFPRSWFKYKNTHHLAPKTKGSSMSPTIPDGSRIVLSLLDTGAWKDMMDERIYVVVDTDGRAHVKRIKNRLAGSGFITLMSDNPDKASYENFNKDATEIQFVWYVEFKVDFRMPNVHDQFYSKVKNIEDSVEDLSRKLSQLEKRLKG